MSVGGLGLIFEPQPAVAPLLARALAGHASGMIEAPLVGAWCVAHVRIVHVRAGSEGTRVGVAFESTEESARLIHGLEHSAVPAAEDIE